jgi:hypothetical protein
MTPAQTQKYIEYVINYSNILRNHISENSFGDVSISASLNSIASTALVVVDRINKGEITTFSALIEACSAMGDDFFTQICNDIDYEYHMNELASRERELYELPY